MMLGLIFGKNGGNFWREEWKSDFCQKRGSTPPHRKGGRKAIRPGRWASGRADGHPGRWSSGQMVLRNVRESGRRKTEDGRKNMKKSCKAPHPGIRADGPPGRQKEAGQAEGIRHQGTFIFQWKLFPSCYIVRLKYKSKNNNINL